MLDYTKIVQHKHGDNWWTENVFYSETESQAFEILKDLTVDIIAKKFNQCTWIKSIKCTMTSDDYHNNTQTITVTYDNDFRTVYTIAR